MEGVPGPWYQSCGLKKSISAGRVFTRKFEQIKKVYKRLSWAAKAEFSVEETYGLWVKVREMRSGVHKESLKDSSEHMAHFIYLAPSSRQVECLNGSRRVAFRSEGDMIGFMCFCVSQYSLLQWHPNENIGSERAELRNMSTLERVSLDNKIQATSQEWSGEEGLVDMMI